MPQAEQHECSLANERDSDAARHDPAADTQAITTPDWPALIVEGIDEALFSVDTSWRFTYLNGRAIALLGQPREALLGQVLWEAFPAVNGSSFEQLYRQVADQQRPARLEDFSPIAQAWYDVRAYPIPAGIIICFRDITARKQLEQSLHDSETRFKVLSESAFEAIVVHRNGTIIEANQSAAHLLGYESVAEFIGQPVAGLVAPESLADVQQRIAGGYDAVYEAVALRKDGSRFPIEGRGRSIEYYGQTVRVIALRDITERKAAEEALRRTQDQLSQAQKMESVGRLAGGVAHDFNNLLTAITGYSELMLEGLGEHDKFYTDLMEIKRAANRAAALTRQLLAFSRRQVLQPRVISLNEVVGGMDILLQRVIGEDIEIVSILDPQLDLVLADQGQVEQVILNLAINARDAMPDGGQLTIEVANVELDEQYRSAGHPEVKTGAYVLLAVSDTGVGMDQATQAQIFEPFFTTKEQGKGTGLGLATVYGIVRQSEGYIWVYSEPGVGTSFKIYFPSIQDMSLAQPAVALAAPAEPEAHQPAIKHPDQEYTILVVEDDTMVGDLIQRVLKEAGYRVLRAQHGQAALELLASHPSPIHMVLTDIVMPHMSGRELVERLRHDQVALKVLCMSGYTEQAVSRHRLLQSCDAFLQKPFTPRTLLQRIAEVAEND